MINVIRPTTPLNLQFVSCISAAYAAVLNLCVWLAVTFVYCVKTAKDTVERPLNQISR